MAQRNVKPFTNKAYAKKRENAIRAINESSAQWEEYEDTYKCIIDELLIAYGFSGDIGFTFVEIPDNVEHTTTRFKCLLKKTTYDLTMRLLELLKRIHKNICNKHICMSPDDNMQICTDFIELRQKLDNPSTIYFITSYSITVFGDIADKLQEMNNSINDHIDSNR
jgi:hypothetical protein